ncbi:RNA polymerase sigma factor [candidate division WOR-3 bacterium]|nr:RNA polymerase sigma factor [candidate division WOR-3 bacterium]
MENEIDFDNIYKSLWPKIYRICHRFVGETEAYDMAQEAFLKFYRAKAKFRGESSYYTYIYRIAVNLCLDRLKKESRLASIETFGNLLVDKKSEKEDPLISKRIAEAFGSLSKQRKAVIVLRILEGLSIRETAGIMNISEGAVKSHLFLAVREMSKKLDSLRSEIKNV